MTSPAARTRRPFVLHEALDLLTRTPAALDAMLRGLPDHWVHAHEGADTWSPFDVVGHLIHCEETDWLVRARIIMEHGDSKPFPAFDRFAQFEASKGRTLADLLDEFAGLRAQRLLELAEMNLTDADLDRRGQHPVFKSVTLRQLLATWVAHDFDHIVQISRVLATQYADEVGPWREYLRVISGKQG